ncbi:MAG: amidohydrolase family protein [Anaerolineaceae bacterium]|nr:amidohydrolase family protein [Anaerolineaceae bacterium]
MLRFYDLNTSIGVWKHPNFGGYETAAELEAVLDYLQVDQAVVYHAQAHESHAPLGNRMLMEELSGHPRLLPSWVIFTHHTGEIPHPSDLIENMLSRGIRIARLLPGYEGHRYSFEDWSAGALFQKLEEHRIPILIDFMFFRRDDPDWKLLFDLCCKYPSLPIILTGWSGLASRTFYPLCKVCPNLYIDTSRYALFRGFEVFCEKVGAKQLLYGSGMPRIAPGVAMTTVTHAFISDEEKHLIAKGNLERLLNEVII